MEQLRLHRHNNNPIAPHNATSRHATALCWAMGVLLLLYKLTLALLVSEYLYNMIQNITFSHFCDEFRNCGRDNQFSYDGKRALYDYLEQYEEDTGSSIEFDVIALCCDYTEYETAWDAMHEYQPKNMPSEGEEGDDLEEIQEANEAEALRWLYDRTQVIEFDGGIIIQDF